jgi:hypothetical protein
MPAITKPSNHFNATLYTGDGTSNRTITGTGFQPDWLWLKMRNDADDNVLVDSVRGGSKRIKSNTTDAESDISYPTLASDGFVVSSGVYNNSAKTFVAWQWKAGGTAVSNTAGTITSSVSANPTAGFSVVTYTGTGANATVGHGLGVAPQMIIVKCRSNASTNFTVYHTSIGNTGYIYLNLTNLAVTGYSGFWNNTSPTSSVFSLGSDVDGYVNGSGRTNVAYCFAPIAGYSAFGSYTGNASTDGPFVYTGFKPKFLMIKRTDTTNSWVIQDTSRSTYNVSQNNIYAESSGAEASYGTELTDILSNGFKQRNTGVSMNASGGTYIYMAFAEAPLKYAGAR